MRIIQPVRAGIRQDGSPPTVSRENMSTVRSVIPRLGQPEKPDVLHSHDALNVSRNEVLSSNSAA